MSGSQSNAEMDALMALGELAHAASGDPGAVDMRDSGGLEARPQVDMMGRELQKWIQCCSCEKWRKVPYSIDEDQIPDTWTCADNVWDPVHNSCEVDQELSDDKIDEILHVQGEQALVYEQEQALLPPRAPEYAGAYDDPYDDDYYDDSSKRGGKKGRLGRGRGRGGRGRSNGTGKQKPRREEFGRGRGGKVQGGRIAHDEAAEALLGMVGGERDAIMRKPGERYYPGRLVWAKVEGHDWWPGKVVRRRAVPREVGLPEDGPNAFRYQIPVVFFTPNGIPGEATLPQGGLDGIIEALKPSSAEEAANEDEAEYAWLVAEALKPFKVGDTCGSPENPPTDELLIQCIEAANRAAEVLEKTKEENGEQYYSSDSDGGWGPQVNSTSMSYRGRRGGRGGRGRKGRSTRRGRGRGRWGRLDDDMGSDEDYEPGYAGGSIDYGSGAPKIIVESILGWRWRESLSSMKDTKKSEEDVAMESAVDALLAAADDGNDKSMEFLVKYIGRSHIHDEWVAESTLMQIAKRKVLNFRKRYGCDLADATPVSLTNESWSIPERFISRRAAPHGPGWEILVKWSSLGIENATWESESESFMSRPDCMKLAKELWVRQANALRRSTPESQKRFEELHEQFSSNITDLEESPQYSDWELMPHQVEGFNWLRRHWANRQSCFFADDQGLGKTATVLSFIRSLRKDFHCPLPILIIAPSSSLAFWEGEFLQWLGDDIDTVTYSGSAVARNILLDHELWLSPSALDGRVVHSKSITDKVPKGDVVLTSHEACASDSVDLSAIKWGLVIFDERHRIQSASLKAHQSINELDALHKVLLGWPAQTSNVQEMMAEVAFINPQYQSLEDLPGNLDEEEDSVTQMKALQAELEPVMLQRSRSIIGKVIAPSYEVRIPVRLRKEQIESYKAVLTKSYEVLGDPKASRFSGYRAVQLRGVVSDLRAVCAHPHIDGGDPLESKLIQIKHQDDLDGALKLSEKLECFDMLLQAEKSVNRRVAVFAHSSSVLSLLSDCMKVRFGEGTYQTIKSTTPSLDCREAVKLFNDEESGVSFIVMHPIACGLGMSLEKLDTVIFFDSDWSVTSDITALCRARKLGKADALRVYRLYCEDTVEERLISFAEKTKGMEVALRQSHGRAYSRGAKVLDEILRAGVESMFSESPSGKKDTEIKQEEEGQDTSDVAKNGTHDAEKRRLISNEYFTGDNIKTLINTDPAEAFERCKSNAGDATECRLNEALPGARVVDLTPLKPDSNMNLQEAPATGEDVSGEEGTDLDAHTRAESALLASKFWSSLLQESWQKYQKERGALLEASMEEDEEEEDDDTGRRISASLGGIPYDDDDLNRRRGRGRSRGRGRGIRRRGDDDDYESGFTKRRRRRDHQNPNLTPEALEYIAEWNRQTAVMNAIADPSTAEALIARNAFDRLDKMGKDLNLPKHIIDLSHQCAQILLVMRPSEEAPSDFQDYTLVAVIAVATYLGQYPMGEEHGIPTLARKYCQDSTSLQQVFEYIIASVNNYRETYMRMQALQEEGALEEDYNDKILRDRGHPTGGLMAAMSDLDGFAAKLNAILQADLRAAALAAGPLETPELDLTANANEQNAAELENLSEKLRSIHEEIDLLDRAQNIRVKNIQDEYQRFMERVRAKAQSAIDHANTTYSQQRSVLMSRHEAISAQIKKDYPHLTQEPPSPQAVGANTVNKPGENGNELPISADGVNPMNMLSHSMASQLLALQSHWAANMAAQVSGEGNQPQYPFGQMFQQLSPEDLSAHLEQYQKMLSDSNQGTEQQNNVLQAMTQAAAQQDGQAAAIHNTGNVADKEEAEKDTQLPKSPLEMMEEDFDADIVADLANDIHDKAPGGVDPDQQNVANRTEHASATEPRPPSAKQEKSSVQADNVVRVSSLSGWMPQGSNPSSPHPKQQQEHQTDT